MLSPKDSLPRAVVQALLPVLTNRTNKICSSEVLLATSCHIFSRTGRKRPVLLGSG